MQAGPDLANDRLTRSIVYPFANATFLADNSPLCIEGGDGVHVFDSQGKRYLDGQAALWNVNVGHGRDEVNQAIVEQLKKLSYYAIFGNTTNRPSIELAERLCRLAAPEGMKRVFYSSGGSEAVEAALKLTRQYWRLIGQPGRVKFLSLRHGYHGVTLGALSLNGRTGLRDQFEPLLPGFYQVEAPHLYRNPFTSDPDALGRRCADLLEREIIYQGPKTVAAFIAEPVQGAGGVIVPPANFWPLVREVCDRHGVLLISDEVVTGFGRIGSMFGCRAFGVRPDMMVFAKGINSGYVPLGATMINERIADAFETSDDTEFSPNAFMHGNTYAGHPLACAAATAALRIVEEERLPENAAEVGQYLLNRLKNIAPHHRNIGDVRGMGLMIGVELVADAATKRPFDLSEKFGARVWRHCVANGLLVRNLMDTFIISPPLTLTKAHADELVDILDAAISAVE
jgi:adenosylmethionine-8-amino-7-oxononanoate aminotransferase